METGDKWEELSAQPITARGNKLDEQLAIKTASCDGEVTIDT